MTYLADFESLLFATFSIEAEDELDARARFRQLLDSETFWHERLLPALRSYEILPENTELIEVEPGDAELIPADEYERHARNTWR